MTLTFNPIPVPLHMDESGSVRVSGSRVTLDILISCYQQGESPEEIAADFPTVPLASVYAVISYYLTHQADVDEYLQRRRQEAAALRAMIEATYDKQAIRERLLARRAELEAQRGATADSG